jgi:hypothetical protein
MKRVRIFVVACKVIQGFVARQYKVLYVELSPAIAETFVQSVVSNQGMFVNWHSISFYLRKKHLAIANEQIIFEISNNMPNKLGIIWKKCFL